MKFRGRLIAKLLQDKGLTQKELRAKLAKHGLTLSVVTLSDRIRGVTVGSRQEDAAYAKAFGLSEADFRAAYEDLERVAGDNADTTGIPLINSAPAGHVINYEEYGCDSLQGYEYLQRDSDTMSKGLFAVIVVGESMKPELMPGDHLVLLPVGEDTSDAAIAGRTVFVRFTEEEGAGCCLAKWKPVDTKKVTLGKLNSHFPSKTYSRDAFARIAVAVQVRRKLK